MYKTHKLIGLGKHERKACTVRWHCRRKRKVEQFKRLSGLSFCRFLGKCTISKLERRAPDGRERKVLYRSGRTGI